jgi:hypothetical protein
MVATTPFATVAEGDVYLSQVDNCLFSDEWFATDLGAKSHLDVDWFAAALSHLHFQAIDYGNNGNLLRFMTTLVGGTNPPTATVAGQSIVIQYLAGVTAAQCKTALEALPAFVALATVTIDGIGSGAVEEMDTTFFSGGIDPDPTRVGWKLPALAMATRKINGLPFKGTKAVPTQVNAFPRSYVLPDGSTYTETSVPQLVKDACCEEALAILKYGDTPRYKLQAMGVGSIQYSATGLKETYKGSKYGSMISGDAMNMLRQFMRRNYVMRR